MPSTGIQLWRLFGDGMAVEWTCVRELARLARRNPRYLVVILPMYARTPLLPVRTTFLRRSYCLARILDDVLDGDRQWSGDPAEMARRLLSDARAGLLDGSDPLRRLARNVFGNIDRLARPGNAPSLRFLVLIETMLFDADRARLGLVLPEEHLSAHLVRTFTSALDTALGIAGATLGAADLPDVAKAQAALYTLRDLEVDLLRGIVNIPAEVVRAARDEGAATVPAEALPGTEAGRAWYARQLESGIRHTEKARSALAASRDRRARWVVGPLLVGLTFLGRRLRRRPLPAPPTAGPSHVALEGV
jgi:phytoene/squalene synthetase